MDHKIVVLVLALLGSVQATCGTVDNCNTCDSGPCTVCNTGYFPEAGVCLACTITVITGSPCPHTPIAQYWLASACGGADKGCTACSGVCPAGKFYVSSKCGAPYYASDGCVECTNCVTSDGPRTKAWGICGGSSMLENPQSTCLNPGPALCRLCAVYVERWFYREPVDPEDPEATWPGCTGEEDHSWVFLPGVYESDLIDACHAAEAEEDEEEDSDCYWESPTVDFPVAAKNSCLYNMVIAAMGIYNAGAGGWPLPVAYPPDPFNVSTWNL